MPLSRSEIQHWAASYIEAIQSPEQLKPGFELWWAIEQFMLVASSAADPEDCWKAILEVLARNPPDEVLGNLAAGPLEDLIHYHGAAFIERIELHARRDPAFRELLRGVWESGDQAIWARVVVAQAYHKA